jgi:hypothetical protein
VLICGKKLWLIGFYYPEQTEGDVQKIPTILIQPYMPYMVQKIHTNP